jgi:hypothetical protein
MMMVMLDILQCFSLLFFLFVFTFFFSSHLNVIFSFVGFTGWQTQATGSVLPQYQQNLCYRS